MGLGSDLAASGGENFAGGVAAISSGRAYFGWCCIVAAVTRNVPAMFGMGPKRGFHFKLAGGS